MGFVISVSGRMSALFLVSAREQPDIFLPRAYQSQGDFFKKSVQIVARPVGAGQGQHP